LRREVKRRRDSDRGAGTSDHGPGAPFLVFAAREAVDALMKAPRFVAVTAWRSAMRLSPLSEASPNWSAVPVGWFLGTVGRQKGKAPQSK
jgi:hypothetical protein